MRHHRLLLAFVVSVALALATAACSKSDTAAAPSSSSCTVTLGAVTADVAAAGTTGTIPVTAASTCAWTAVSSASFLSVTSGASGTGNGSVAYSIAANTGAARSASISVNGSVANFVQQAATLQAPTGCSVTVAPTSVRINSGGGTANIAVTAASNCGWVATSNASFLTVQATATGNGTVVITAAANNGPARTGTVTIGGQTVTVTQDPGVFASFNLFDPGQSTGATNSCQIRSLTNLATTCTLRSTSFTAGTNTIATYAWTVQYTYGTVKVINSTSTISSLAFSDTCGGMQSTDDGAFNPLDVTLTITDSNGNTSTARSGSGTQPALFVQLFTCGR